MNMFELSHWDHITDDEVEKDIQDTLREIDQMERQIKPHEMALEHLKNGIDERRIFVEKLREILFQRRARRVRERTEA